MTCSFQLVVVFLFCVFGVGFLKSTQFSSLTVPIRHHQPGNGFVCLSVAADIVGDTTPPMNGDYYLKVEVNVRCRECQYC